MLAQSIPANNTTGIRGVIRDNRSGGYIAQIKFGGKNIRLGHFKKLADAAEARRAAEIEYFDPVLIANGLPPTSEEEYQANLKAAIEREKGPAPQG